MAQRIFITATNTDIGKTYATRLLISALTALGYRVGAIKPIETGVETEPLDGSTLLQTLKQHNPQLAHLEVSDIVPIQFKLPAAPYVANEGRHIDLSPVDEALAAIEPLCDVVLIEGAGGLLVPIDESTMIIDLIKRYDASALLVSHGRLGCINDTLLNISLLESRQIPFVWTINDHGENSSFKTVSEPYFLDRFGSYFELTRDLDEIARSLLKL